MALTDQRLAFLVTEDAKASEVLQSVRLLEETGLHVDVIGAQAHAESVNGRAAVASRPVGEVSPADYCALALPADVLARPNAPGDPTVLRFIEAMRALGRPVMYVPLGGGAPAQASQSAGPPFSFKRLLADSWRSWNEVDAPRLGAALAYYALLSLAPLTVLIVSITDFFFERTMVENGLLAQVRQLIGDAGVTIVSSALKNSKLSTGLITGTIGILILLLGASGVFLELRDSLDTVWGVKPAYGSGLLSLIRARAFAFLMVIGTGMVLAASLLATAILATPARFVLHFLPKQWFVTALVTVSLSLVTGTLIFALIFKSIPDIRIRWNDVWIGAAVTAALFTAGKALIGIYLTTAGIGSAYAAAGSFVVFLTWVYYSAQIFLFGAEFTHLYAIRHGSYSIPARLRRIKRRRGAAGVS